MDIEIYRWNRMELNGYFMIFPNFLLGLYGDVRLAPLAHVRIKWGKNQQDCNILISVGPWRMGMATFSKPCC